MNKKFKRIKHLSKKIRFRICPRCQGQVRFFQEKPVIIAMELEP